LALEDEEMEAKSHGTAFQVLLVWAWVLGIMGRLEAEMTPTDIDNAIFSISHLLEQLRRMSRQYKRSGQELWRSVPQDRETAVLRLYCESALSTINLLLKVNK
jgi:hypothetical protein